MNIFVQYFLGQPIKILSNIFDLKDTTLILFGNDVILTSYKFEIAVDLLILSI